MNIVDVSNAEPEDPKRTHVVTLADRYHEILELRIEGLKKYHARLVSEIFGPPAFVTIPTVSFRSPSMPSMKIGPLYFGDNPPILPVVDEWIRRRKQPLTILEFGPGKGTLAAHLKKKYGQSINGYYGIDRDPHVVGPYERITSVGSAPVNVDLVIASEVIEHMPLDDFFNCIVLPSASRLVKTGALIIGTPNALSPGSIFRDFTHVQGYSWYDLYGILRLAFSRVDVYRTHYVWLGKRLLWLLPRMLLVKPLELDWCDGLVCVASAPRDKA